MKVIKSFRQVLGPAFFEKALLVLLGGSALLSFVLVLEQNFLLQFVPVSLQNLVPVGVVDDKSGKPFRKLRNDSLHLPINTGSTVYLDDILTTDSGSEVKVRLKLPNSTEDFFILEPSSVIRVSLNNGELLIDLKQGSLNTHFQSDKMVHVRTGTLTTALKIKKGTYLIKNSFMGIQITLFTQELQVKKNPEDDASEQNKARAAEDEKGSKADTLTPDAEIGYPPGFKLPVKLPFPEDRQVFLVSPGTEKKKIVILAKKSCDTNCRLTVKCETSEIADVNFDKGAAPSLTLTANLNPSCKTYRWTFRDGETTFERTFHIEDYTDEIFNRYLTEGLSIEII